MPLTSRSTTSSAFLSSISSAARRASPWARASSTDGRVDSAARRGARLAATALRGRLGGGKKACRREKLLPSYDRRTRGAIPEVGGPISGVADGTLFAREAAPRAAPLPGGGGKPGNR